SSSYGPFSSPRNDAPPRRESRNYPRRKKKIFSRDEGEYVEFEEIEVTADHHRAPSNQDSAYTPCEPQVSDADWEEIR
ncbi:DUF4834 family protein, partial [uncultured Duncaniella sp.]